MFVGNPTGTLPPLPIDIWTEIGKYLNLEDSFNLYRAHLTTYDFKINDYFPLNRIREWSADITDLYSFCDDCRLERGYDFYDEIYPEEDDSDSDGYYNTRAMCRIRDCHEFTCDPEYVSVYLRSTINVAYQYKLKPRKLIDLVEPEDPEDPEEPEEPEDRMCVFHDDNMTSKLCDQIYKMTLETFKKAIELELRICYKCGGVDHKPYDQQCLFRSQQLRKDYRKEKKRIKEDRRRRELLRKFKEELRLAYQARTPCVNCHKSPFAYDCQNDLCGFCCLDDNCQRHVNQRKKRVHNERKQKRKNDRRHSVAKV